MTTTKTLIHKKAALLFLNVIKKLASEFESDNQHLPSFILIHPDNKFFLSYRIYITSLSPIAPDTPFDILNIRGLSVIRSSDIDINEVLVL